MPQLAHIPAQDSTSCLLAIDFGGTKIAMATATPAGQRLTEREIPTLAHEGAERVMARMHQAAQQLVLQTEREHGRTLGAVAAVTPGIVGSTGILLAPNNPGWETLPMAAELERMFGVTRIRVETDVKAAALAEARSGALRNLPCGLYVNLGTGLAAAAVIDGKVLRGAHGAAGEIAYQLRGVPGEVPFCRGGAPLEQFISGKALADRASALLGRAISCRQAFDLAPTHAQLAAMLDEALEALVVHVVNIVLTLDPARIAIGGGMARVAHIIPTLVAGLKRACPFPPEVVLAAFEEGAALEGAVQSGMEALAN